MILPTIDGYGRPVILSPQYQSPYGYSKQQGLDTKSSALSNALKGGVLLSPVYGLTVSGAPSPYSTMPEFGHSQVPLYYQGGLYYDQPFGFQYDPANIANWCITALSAWTSIPPGSPPPLGSVPAIDCWSNAPGQYPGDYPNRTPGPANWYDPSDTGHTNPLAWPKWTLTAITVPHTGVGDNSSWTLGTGAPDRCQVSVTTFAPDWDGGQIAWGQSFAMPGPNQWADIMEPSGLTLPFRTMTGTSSTAWNGSQVSIVRIPKPGYPYH